MLSRSLALALVLPVALHAQQPVTTADYARARGLGERINAVATGAAMSPTWIDATRLWYRKSVSGGSTFILVDARNADAPSKGVAFDHERLATALNAAEPEADPKATALKLPFTTIAFADEGARLTFTAWSANWSCAITDYQCSKSPLRTGAGPGAQFGGGANTLPREVASPDGRSIAYVNNYNVFVRPAGPATTGTALSTNGSEGNPFTVQSIVWSPDSRRLVAFRVQPGYRRLVRYVVSSPADQVQPSYMEREYAKPGDVLDLEQPALFDLDAKSQVDVDRTLFPSAYDLARAQWRRDSRAFTFEYNERGHQRYRVIEVDGKTGLARALIDEASSTFIDYRRAAGTLTDGGRVFRFDINDGNEIVWLSERDGWAHLYLYDGRTGTVKNQVTKGPFVVRAVQFVDTIARQVYFSAGGMNAGQDPYFAHYYRVNLDGSGLKALTDAPADHNVSYSTDRQLYIDHFSRLDMSPVTQLRRTSDGRVLMELERGDLTALTAAGWRAPDVFVAKGRDGTTDIHGMVIRPSRFDPKKKYPVIENIYAGPHGSFVPKSFSAFYRMSALADLGFIVVQIDGMGTANRSRAFHDVAWKNLGDAGFPDRILWHKAFAATHAWYDISRVGIYGGSAGGQNALGGLLFHSDFYKVAVAFAGCHDNRMDKIWWNEQWMGYPIGPEYEASSNVVHAAKLQGKLLLVLPELDTNVDPSSTMQVVNALVKANKEFDLLVLPGEDHGGGRGGRTVAYGDRKLWDFFVANLIGSKPPAWNAIADVLAPSAVRVGNADAGSIFTAGVGELAASWFREPK